MFYPLEKFDVRKSLFIALCILFCFVKTLFGGFHIGKNEFEIYGFDIADGVYRAVNVNNVAVVETADDMNYRVNFSYI